MTARVELLDVAPPPRPLERVRVVRVELDPGQRPGRHRHPCAVVGHIVSGVAIYQLEGEAEQILRPGDAFYEPADAVVARFDNAAEDEPLVFVANYLLADGGDELIEMLP